MRMMTQLHKSVSLGFSLLEKKCGELVLGLHMPLIILLPTFHQMRSQIIDKTSTNPKKYYVLT